MVKTDLAQGAGMACSSPAIVQHMHIIAGLLIQGFYVKALV